jgi:3-oxoadipate enol-lactonase
MPHLDINGSQIHYRIDGTDRGRTIVLSNSLASNLHMWGPQIQPLVDAGFRVVRYDSRGHGRSAAPEGPYNIEQLADDAAGLIDGLELGPVHFCGLSKGGMVAQNLGYRYAGKVLSLVICASAAHLAPASVWDDRIALVHDNGMAAIADATLERWFTPPGHARMPDTIAAVKDMILSTPAAGFIACCEAIKVMDQRESNRSITTPTTVIVGSDDPSTTPAHAREIAAAIDGAHVVEIADAAHFVNMEQAGPFQAALAAHLDAHA